MKAKPPVKGKAFLHGKIHPILEGKVQGGAKPSTTRCQAASENENPNKGARRIFSTMTSKANIRVQESTMKKAKRVDTRELRKVYVAKVVCKENAVDSQTSDKTTGKDPLLNVSDSYIDSKKPVTGEQMAQQGHFSRQICRSSRHATIPATVPPRRVLVNRRLDLDCIKTGKLPDFVVTDKSRPTSAVRTTSSNTLQEPVSQASGDRKPAGMKVATQESGECQGLQVVNEAKEHDGRPSEKIKQDGSAEEIQGRTEISEKVSDCNGRGEARVVEQKKASLEGLLRRLRLASCDESGCEEQPKEETKDREKEEKQQKMQLRTHQQATNKGKKRKSTELNFKLNCSSKEHGKKNNKILFSTYSTSTCLSSCHSVSSSTRPTVVSCGGQHKKSRTVPASAPSPAQPFKLFNLRTEARGALRELEMNKKEFCSSIVAEGQLEENEEIKKLREQMVHHALRMPFFGKPFQPQRSTKKLTVPKEPNFHAIRSRKACMKHQHLIPASSS